MKIVLRNTLTNELIVELFDDVEEGLDDNDIQEMLSSANGIDEEIEELLQDDNYYLSYE